MPAPIVEKIVASALIYLPSSAKDFANPQIEPYLARFVRGGFFASDDEASGG